MLRAILRFRPSAKIASSFLANMHCDSPIKRKQRNTGSVYRKSILGRSPVNRRRAIAAAARVRLCGGKARSAQSRPTSSSSRVRQCSSPWKKPMSSAFSDPQGSCGAQARDKAFRRITASTVISAVMNPSASGQERAEAVRKDEAALGLDDKHAALLFRKGRALGGRHDDRERAARLKANHRPGDGIGFWRKPLLQELRLRPGAPELGWTGLHRTLEHRIPAVSFLMRFLLGGEGFRTKASKLIQANTAKPSFRVGATPAPP